MRATFILAIYSLLISVATAKIPSWNTNQTTLNICTSEWTPAVYCVDRPPEEYSGYEIELFRKIYRTLGWTDDMLTWSCLDWDEMMNHAYENDGFCDIIVAGIEATAEDKDAGLVFTWPTYRNGLRVAVAVDEQNPSYFAFFDAFSWQLWLAIVLTAAVVAVVTWVIDWYLVKYRHAKRGLPPTYKQRRADKKDFERYLVETYGVAVNSMDHEAITLPSNLIIVVYGFLILTMVRLILFVFGTT